MTKFSMIRLSLLFLLFAFLGIWIHFNLSHQNPEKINQNALFLEALYRKGNYIEAGIWGIFSVGFSIAAIKNSGRVRVQRILGAMTFFLFGLSDIVEVKTGAWWHPWWLLLWKSFCILSMVTLLMMYWWETHPE